MTADLKTQIHDFAQEFAAALPSVDAESITRGHESDQMISAVLTPKRRWSSWIVPALAVVLVVVLIGGAALIFANPEGREVADPLPPPSVVLPTVVEDVIPETAPPARPAPEAVEPAAPITGMAWQQIAPTGIDPAPDGRTALVSGGDRFLYFHEANKSISTSVDGINWITQPLQGSVNRALFDFVGWRDTIVGFGCGGWVGIEGKPITPQPGCVSVINADGTVARQSFDAQIVGAGIGPSGIVMIGTNSYDEDGLQYAAEDELAWNLTGRDINDFRVFELTEGVLHVESFDGQIIADYVLSDHGYADIESPGASGWFTQDGADWTPIPDFPVGREWDLIGTGDGFVAVSDDSNGSVVVWHSPNGLDWRELGQSPINGQTLSRWGNGAIVAGEEGVWSISGLGIVETPLATTGLGEFFISTSDRVGVVVLVDGGLNQILYSPDGQTWISTNVPPEMSDLELAFGMYPSVQTAATDTGVLLHLSVFSDGADPASVWYLGTPTTD